MIILTGYPCSGLTYRAHQLAALLESAQDRFLPAAADTTTTDSSQKPRYKIHVVPSHDSSHPRTVYDNARTEKEARAVVFARVKRALGRDTIVLVDGMNYIKGWRYQLWCEAKAVGTTCCVVRLYTSFLLSILAADEPRMQNGIPPKSVAISLTHHLVQLGSRRYSDRHMRRDKQCTFAPSRAAGGTIPRWSIAARKWRREQLHAKCRNTSPGAG